MKFLLVITVALLCGLSTGCCLWRQQNPVKESVVTSRQFSQQGLNALSKNDLKEAEGYCSQAVRACPVDPHARRYYADVLWAQGRYQEALEQIDLAMGCPGVDQETRLRAVEMCLACKKTDAALVEVERVIDNDPKSSDAWALRGRIMRQAGNSKQALADMQRALVYSPKRRDVLQETADLYRQLGEPHKTLAALQELADTYGPGEEPPSLFEAQGDAYAALARPTDAARQYRYAAKSGAESPTMLANWAEAEAASGNMQAAYEAAQKALAAAPQDPRNQELIQRTAAAVIPANDVLRR